MDDLKKQEQAANAFAVLCDTLDARSWNYSKDEVNGNNLVRFGVNGDDIPMDLIIVVDTDRALLRVLSQLPVKFPEDKRVEGAIAACIVSNNFADGNFDYDLNDGSVTYRMTASYRDCEIGQELCAYLVDCTCSMVDKYNDKFLMLAKGMIELDAFLDD